MDFIIVILVVSTALGYVGWKAWGLLKPGPRTPGCGCGSAKGSCSGCPLVKD